MIIVLAVAVLLTLGLPTGPAHAQSSNYSGPIIDVNLRSYPAESLDTWIEAEMRERRIPGLAIAVVDRGRVVKARGYGLANVELGVTATEHTIFQSGSVGKTFTAAAVLLLVEDGRLSLGDPITRYLDELPEGWRLITIRHLLSHTSGLPDYWEPTVDLRRDYTEGELLQAFSSLTPHSPPGEQWSYSNTGYVILGALVSRMTGDHWSKFVMERIFEPAGMKTARVISEAAVVPNRAAGYRLVGDEWRNHDWVSPTFNSTADGALYLTVLDLVRWDEALHAGSILSGESQNLMWTPARLSDGEDVGYGLGWQVGHVNGQPYMGHGGAWQGFNAHITRFPEDSLAVIVLANLARAGADQFAAEIAARYRPSLRPTPPLAIDLPEEVLAAYIGFYWHPSGRILEVSRVEGGLAMAGAGPPGTVFRPYDDDAFFVEDTPLRLNFHRGPHTGRVEHLSTQHGLRARKIR
jgi:D-alanyl-D-alanine carboxypeptidase